MHPDPPRVRLPARLAVATLVAMTTAWTGVMRGQANLVRLVSPSDLVLQPTDPVAGTVRLEFEFDPRVRDATLFTRRATGDADTASKGPAGDPFKVPATVKALTWTPCSAGAELNPDDVWMVYYAHDAKGAGIDVGNWHFKIGPDKTKPAVRVVSPKDETLVVPGETVDVVVAGEESKTAATWQRGLRRLSLIDPSLNTERSPETPSALCGDKAWQSQHHFRYVVPRDAEPGILSLTAGAEDWAGNIDSAPLDLAVRSGLTGVWTTVGREATPDFQVSYVVKAAFSASFNPRTHALECGTLSHTYCGTGGIFLVPARGRGHQGNWCDITFTPAHYVFKIVAHGVQQGTELKFLDIKNKDTISLRYRMDCPTGPPSFESTGLFPVGSILPEGITIPIPQSGDTTVTKHQTLRTGVDVDHTVHLYAPPNKR